MIEATAAPAPDDALVGKPAPRQADRSVPVPGRALALSAGWLVFSVGLAWFIYAGSVRVGAGHWLGQRLRVRVIWTRFLAFLADQGANSLMVGLVVFMALVTLLGSLAVLWWVLGQRDDGEPPVVPDAK
ncbi:MAG TPA: hypothetical protein VEY69_11685 [Lautropia sp.]|nr:hypothetical protein [Lautropia sp.]